MEPHARDTKILEVLTKGAVYADVVAARISDGYNSSTDMRRRSLKKAADRALAPLVKSGWVRKIDVCGRAQYELTAEGREELRKRQAN